LGGILGNGKSFGLRLYGTAISWLLIRRTRQLHSRGNPQGPWWTLYFAGNAGVSVSKNSIRVLRHERHNRKRRGTGYATVRTTCWAYPSARPQEQVSPNPQCRSSAHEGSACGCGSSRRIVFFGSEEIFGPVGEQYADDSMSGSVLPHQAQAGIVEDRNFLVFFATNPYFTKSTKAVLVEIVLDRCRSQLNVSMATFKMSARCPESSTRMQLRQGSLAVTQFRL